MSKLDVTLEEIRAQRDHKIEMPPRKRWGEAVPAEGTHCSNCEYLKDAKKMICGNPNFIAWNGGSNKIPATDPAKYCSIWWDLK